MKLTRTNYPPSSPLGDVDAFFRSALGGFSEFGRILDQTGLLEKEAVVPVDIFEDDDNFIVRLEVPGVKKEDIDVQLEERVLTVEISKTEACKASEAQAEDNECGTSTTRRLSVPESVDGAAVTAKLEDGILTLNLPKSEEAKLRTISID